MDTQDPPNQPRYQLTRGLRGLDNEKDAMTSTCLDRKEVRDAISRMHSTGTGWPVATQDGFFCHLAGRSTPTGLAIVHWIGYTIAYHVGLIAVLGWPPGPANV